MTTLAGNPKYQGYFTALVSPMTENGDLDETAYQSFVQWQIDQGIQGLVPVGTTGESPTLTHDEHMRLISSCVEVAKGKVPVIAGAGSNSTREALALGQHAQNAGADAILVVTPYYNKPSQEGLYQHYKTIAEGVDLPIIVYNIPGRSVIDMTTETLFRLVDDCPNITGVKDASGDGVRVLEMHTKIGADFTMLSGDDPMMPGFYGSGGHGCISVTSNVAPKMTSDIHRAWVAGDTKTALDLSSKLYHLHVNLFVAPNPGPAKYALSLLGKMNARVRLPLVPCDDDVKAKVRFALDYAGLL